VQEAPVLKVVLLVLLVLLVIAVATAVRRRGPGATGPEAGLTKAATDRAVISRQGHGHGSTGYGGGL